MIDENRWGIASVDHLGWPGCWTRRPCLSASLPRGPPPPPLVSYRRARGFLRACISNTQASSFANIIILSFARSFCFLINYYIISLETVAWSSSRLVVARTLLSMCMRDSMAQSCEVRVIRIVVYRSTTSSDTGLVVRIYKLKVDHDDTQIMHRRRLNMQGWPRAVAITGRRSWIIGRVHAVARTQSIYL